MSKNLHRIPFLKKGGPRLCQKDSHPHKMGSWVEGCIHVQGPTQEVRNRFRLPNKSNKQWAHPNDHWRKISSEWYEG